MSLYIHCKQRTDVIQAERKNKDFIGLGEPWQARRSTGIGLFPVSSLILNNPVAEKIDQKSHRFVIN